MISAEQADVRFAFGRNWHSFLTTLTVDRIAVAEQSLRDMLGVTTLQGTRFLDIGCGSGLFSVAARRLGATVHSLDYDRNSVACALTLRDRFFPGDAAWTIEEGSAIDPSYMDRLGTFDTVYTWGVLHHTGEMWKGVRLAAARVAPGGRLFLALYNDQGWRSAVWARIKRLYCSGPLGRAAVLAVGVPYFAAVAVAAGLVKHRHPFGEFIHYRRHRGMSITHDWVDWLGGYPFEVATPAAVFQTLHREGFSLEVLKTTQRLGCNEFVFRRG